MRSFGANHVAEMAGGAAMMLTPEIPFRMEEMWLVTRKYLLCLLTDRSTVPAAMKKETSRVVSLRPLQKHAYNFHFPVVWGYLFSSM